MPFLDRKVIAAIHLQAHGLLWKGLWRERRPEGPTQLRFYLLNRHVLDQAAKPVASIEVIEAVGEAHWPDYFRTLAQWRDRFEASWAAISSLGFDDNFRRRWRYYLCYCEAGFSESAIDVGVYRFRRVE